MGGRGAKSSQIKNNIHKENNESKYRVIQRDERTGETIHWGNYEGSFGNYKNKGYNFTGQEAFNFIKTNGGKIKDKLIVYDAGNGNKYKYTPKGFVKITKK